MNTLTWFLYFADVIPALGKAFALLSIPTLLGSFSLLIGFLMTSSPGNEEENEVVKKMLKTFLPVGLICLLLSIAAPSTKTIYLMMGSEAGEAVATSEQGKEILDDVRQVIKDQLNSLKKDE